MCGRWEKRGRKRSTIARCKTPGVVERKSAQQAAARDVPGVVECKLAQQAVAIEEPAVQEHESRQRAVARLNKIFEMACEHCQFVKLVKGNTNSVLMDFQKTTSILFYVDVRYVSVCYNNLCNKDEVIDRTRHKHPPIIIQLQDATLSLSSSNTLSLSSSDTLSSLSSDNSSRSLTSVRSRTNSDDDSLFPSSSQLTKNGKSNSSENKHANYILSFCDWAMGTMSESCYDNPH